MQKWFVKVLFICTLITLFGCTKEEEVLPPQNTSMEIITKYLDAMKQQDGVTMSAFTLSGTGDNFTIKASDAEAIGLTEDSAKTMMEALFSFTYTCAEKLSTDTNKASIDVTITTYDVKRVLEDTIANHKTEFTNIQKSKDDATATQEIANILVSAFHEASQDYVDTYTFDLTLVENTWKIEDENIQEFYAILLNTILE